MFRKLLEFLCVSSVLMSLCHAQLTFKETLKAVTAKPDTKAIFIEFPFWNKSDETVTIVEYDAPCTCMGARIRRQDGKESLVFEPGDKGVIIGKLDFENFKGTIDKMITIKTDKDKGPDPSIKLTCRVTIPVIMSASVERVEWKVGDANTAKEFFINVDHTKPLHITKHKIGFGGDDVFDYKVETIENGKQYKVTVTPKKTTQPFIAPIKFYTDSAIDRFKLVQVYAVINTKEK